MVRFGYGLLFVLLTGLFAVSPPACAKTYQPGDTERGRASWYGIEEQGEKTSSGERFDRHQFTAAHRYLPFGSIVRVKNLTNGASVEVRINDRGPWGNGRIIDLSEAAADVLKMKNSGTAPVEITVIRLGSPEHAQHA